MAVGELDLKLLCVAFKIKMSKDLCLLLLVFKTLEVS